MESIKELDQKLESLREQMNQPDFWQDKQSAKQTVAEYEQLKKKRKFLGSFDTRNAVLSIISGAGGLDAEDFASMLLEMYGAYVKDNGWDMQLIHEHGNDHGGIKNITVDVVGDGVYGNLRHESGVHRLVRQSPFNTHSKRHTSFALVEVVPEMKDVGEIDLDENDLKIEFSKSSGAGGQNVNKRETAVRIVHQPTGLSAHADRARSQKENRQKALEILRGKLYHKKQADRRAKAEQFQPTTSADNEWGNQMRSYVLHPYQKVKDHRTGYEESDTEAVFDGEIQGFIQAAKESDNSNA